MFETRWYTILTVHSQTWLLVDDGNFDADFKDDTLRDIVVFRLRYDEVCKYAIALWNTLPFNQIHNQAKLMKAQNHRIRSLLPVRASLTYMQFKVKRSPVTWVKGLDRNNFLWKCSAAVTGVLRNRMKIRVIKQKTIQIQFQITSLF